MKVITLLLVALIIVLAMPANAVDIASTAIVVGGNANAPPTIDNVVTDINLGGKDNCIGDTLLIDISVEASDFNGAHDINDVFVKLYKVKPSTGELIWLNETHLTSFTNIYWSTGIYEGTLVHYNEKGYLPGSYVLKVQVFDNSGASDSNLYSIFNLMILGDFNGDGCVDGFDVYYLARHIVLTPGFEDVYSNELDGDNLLDGFDVYYLARAIVMDPDFPL